MMRLAIALVAVLAGCKQYGYQCQSNTECTQAGAVGTCESTGYCAFPDPGCQSGRRYGDYAGGYSGECVDGTSGVDASNVDTRQIDAPGPDGPPNAITKTFGETGLADFSGVAIDAEIQNVSMTNVSQNDHTSSDTISLSIWRFDVTAIPTTATVVSARFVVETYDPDNLLAAGGTVQLYRVKEAWDETTVTFFMRDMTNAWTNQGVETPVSRDGALLASFPADAVARLTVNLPAAMVQGWVTTPTSNAGFLGDTVSAGHAHFASRKHPTAATRPLLSVTYVE